MTRPGRMLGAALGLVGWLAACSTTSAVPAGGGTSVARVTGTVTYRERIALPPTAVIKVQLVDVSRADTPAIVLGEQITQAAGKQVPFAFEIQFDPARIEALLQRGNVLVAERLERLENRADRIVVRNFRLR